MPRDQEVMRLRHSVDTDGRGLPLAAEQDRHRREAALHALDAVLEIGDEAEQARTLEALNKAIDPTGSA